MKPYKCQKKLGEYPINFVVGKGFLTINQIPDTKIIKYRKV